MPKNKPILSDQARIVYAAEKLADISDFFIDSLGWPAAIPSLGIMLEPQDGDEYDLIKENISEKYSVRVVYGVKSESLCSFPPPDLSSDVTLSGFASQKTLIDWYINTQEEYFYKPWSQYVPISGLVKAREFAKKYALPENAVCFKKSDAVVGLAVVVRWRDWFGAAEDLLAWVWFDAGLSREDRAAAHDKMLIWL